MPLIAEGLVPLSEATDVAVVGGKAASLGRAIDNGHAVPDGVVVPIGLADRDAWVAVALNGLLDRLGGRVAVRSSGIGEDGIDASLAGKHASFLDVSSHLDLVHAVAACVRSGATGSDNRSASRSLAVIVQRMLHPSAAGVAFSADPVTGDDRVVIEATAGLGHDVLAGAITGERWIGDPQPARVTGAATALTVDEARRVAAVCRRLAVERGHHVDVEWGIEHGRLWLLQVRPITALPLRPSGGLPEGQSFVREPRVERPLHPLSFTSWFPIHGAVVAEVFEEFGIPAATIESRHHLGRVFARVTPLVDRGRDDRSPPHPLLKLLAHVTPTMRRRIQRASAWDGDQAIAGLIEDWEKSGRARTRARTTELRDFDRRAASDEELAGHIDAVQHHVRQVARHHVRLSIGAMAIPTGRLGLFTEDRLGWSVAEAIDLVQGSGHASTAHSDAIADLADRLGPDGVDRAIADPSTLLDHPEAVDYVQRFGHSVDLDLSQPTEVEDPTRTINHLRRHRDDVGSDRRSDPSAAATRTETRAMDALDSDADRHALSSMVRLARRGRPLADETAVEVLRALSPMRHVGLEVGRRWSSSGRLRDPSDVWFLELDELCWMLRAPTRSAPDLDRRRREHRWHQTHPAPDLVGPPPPPLLPPSLAGRRHRMTLGAALWAFAAMQDRPVEQPAERHLLQGVPGSPGQATGLVRLVRHESEFDQVEPGEIVVCVATTASWSAIFSTIAGLITEHGGPLSHPATLAREHGLPAVLAVPDATKHLADGTRLHIDGASGVIEILA